MDAILKCVVADAGPNPEPFPNPSPEQTQQQGGSVLQSFVSNASRQFSRPRLNELGQTSTEYVAVLVVGVGLAVAVGWFVLSPILADVVNDLRTTILSVFE